jgi:tetratricopeptide (TPR) repeat protein
MLNAGDGYSDVLAFAGKISATQLNNHIVWYEHANTLDELGMYEEAVIAYQQALKIKADFQDAWISLGAVLCDHFQKYEEALECLFRRFRLV